MLKKLIIYIWSIRYQFIKYTCVGSSGFILDIGTLIVFTEKFGLWPTLSVILNQAIVLTYNFTLNKYWSFRNTEIPHKQIVRYATLAGCNYLFSVVMMYIFNAGLGYDYKLVRIGTILIMVAWNFLLYKHWVYREEVEREK